MQNRRRPRSTSAASLPEDHLISLFFVAISVMGASLVLAGAPATQEPAREAARQRRPRAARPIEVLATPELLPQPLAAPTTGERPLAIDAGTHAALGL